MTIPKPVITKLISDLKYISKLATLQHIEIVPEKISAVFDNNDASVAENVIDEMPSGSKSVMNDDKTVSHKCNLSLSSTEESKPDTIESVKEPNPKQIKMESDRDNDSTPSTSHDFIPILPEKPSYVGDDTILGLRGAGDFKYGYNDIITGTFREKLEECLAKGVKITSNCQDVESLNLVYYEERLNNMSKSHFKKMLVFREKLPTYKKRKEILEVIQNNQVIVISGETGCGKSTQV